ncbi:hypothetical protein U9M48_009680, partial [Paspalum notatum var. saurae]
LLTEVVGKIHYEPNPNPKPFFLFPANASPTAPVSHLSSCHTRILLRCPSPNLLPRSTRRPNPLRLYIHWCRSRAPANAQSIAPLLLQASAAVLCVAVEEHGAAHPRTPSALQVSAPIVGHPSTAKSTGQRRMRRSHGGAASRCCCFIVAIRYVLVEPTQQGHKRKPIARKVLRPPPLPPASAASPPPNPSPE